MRNLWLFFIKYYAFFLFLVLETIAFSMVIRNHDYQERNRDLRRVKRMLKDYAGLPEEIAWSVVNGESECLICGSKDRLVIDHCHETGRFRAVLCNRHNAALGMCKEDSKELEALKKYAEFCEMFRKANTIKGV